MRNTTDLKLRNMEDSGREYIEEILREIGALGRHITSTTKLAEWSVRALVPDRLPDDLSTNFRQGGIFRGHRVGPPYRLCLGHSEIRVENTRAALIWMLNQISKGDDANYLAVFGNWVADPEDPWIVNYDGKVFFYEKDVYHYDQLPADKDVLERSIRHSKTVPYYAGICARFERSGPRLQTRSKINHDTLSEIADAAAMIFVGAYDGESYLFAFDSSSVVGAVMSCENGQD